MGEAFDPYYKWLAIPPGEQPPNHYRLLGVPLFEPDHDVIEAAADQRMSYVRAHHIGRHRELSQQLLNEIAAAKVCLLDPGRREIYDRELRHTLAPSIPALPQPPAPRQVAVRPPAPLPVAAAIVREARRASVRGDQKRKQNARVATLGGLCLAAVLATGGLIALNRRPQAQTPNSPASHSERGAAAASRPEAARELSVLPAAKELAAASREVANDESEPSSPDWVRGAVLALDCESASRIEDNGATRFRDLSGQKNDAQLHDGMQSEGKIGEGIALADTGGFLECADADSLNATNQVTIALWAKAGAWGMRDLVSKEDWDGGGARGYVLRQVGADRFDFTVGASEWRGAESGSGMQMGRWHHVAGVFDGEQIRLYVDGLERGATTYSGAIEASHYKLRVGSCQFSPERQFVGAVDEIAVWNRALTADELRSLYDYSNQGQSYCRAIGDAAPGDSALPPQNDPPATMAAGHAALGAPPPSAANIQLPDPSLPAARIESWFALAGAGAEDEGTEKVCAADRSLHTALTWAHSPEEAAAQAAREGKLLFLIHVSGNFEDPGFT